MDYESIQSVITLLKTNRQTSIRYKLQTTLISTVSKVKRDRKNKTDLKPKGIFEVEVVLDTERQKKVTFGNDNITLGQLHYYSINPSFITY